jgi:hypothetical protein
MRVVLGLIMMVGLNCALASYITVPMHYLILKDVLIIEGKIDALSDTAFVVKINNILSGIYAEKTIGIERFNNWTCGSRWTTYEIGHNAVFFLGQSENGLWHVVGGGNEGELPILKDSIYVKATWLDDACAISAQNYSLHGSYFMSGRFSLRHFTEAIPALKQCYRYAETGIERLVSKDLIDGLRTKSPVLGWLITKCESELR